MSWTFHLKFLQDENIIADFSKDQPKIVKPLYSVLLTNKRLILRFDGLGSLLKKSFYYNEILDAKTMKRLGIHYLLIRTNRKEFLFHTAQPAYWADKIMDMKAPYTGSSK